MFEIVVGIGVSVAALMAVFLVMAINRLSDVLTVHLNLTDEFVRNWEVSFYKVVSRLERFIEGGGGRDANTNNSVG